MMQENHLEKLEEFVCDEDKIVTVPWLCRTLALTAKDAKQLLNKYIKHSRQTQSSSLSVVYVLSGLCDNKPTISIAKEDELEDKKELYSMSPIVDVYSIQKSQNIDFNGVALVDSFNTDCSRLPVLGSAVSKNCVKRNFKPKKALPPPPAPTVKEKTSFFKRQPPKSPNSTLVTNGTSKAFNTKTASNSKQSSFNNFFTSCDQKSKKKEPTKATTETKPTAMLIDSDSDSEIVIQPEIKKEKTTNNKNTAKKRESSTKRRKRIVVQEESDDDIFGSDCDNDNEENQSQKRKNVITDSDEEPLPFKLEPLPEVPKNKKRKLVDRAFLDEEGYTITKKEWVEEDASDTDNVPTVGEVKTKLVVKQEDKSATDNKSKQTISPKNEKAVNGKVQKGKGKKELPTNQSTIMSFFKRK